MKILVRETTYKCNINNQNKVLNLYFITNPSKMQLMELDGKVIEQKMKFNYLGIELSSFGDIEAEMRDQTTKAIRIAGCLNTIWCNKGTKIKSRIYKIVVRPVIYTQKPGQKH